MKLDTINPGEQAGESPASKGAGRPALITRNALIAALETEFKNFFFPNVPEMSHGLRNSRFNS